MNNSKKALFGIFILSFLNIGMAENLGFSSHFTHGMAPVQPTTLNPCDFRSAMRKLWEDHVTWTRIVIGTINSDEAENQAAVKRLLKNQQDIGDAIVPFYGKKAGEKLTQLLTDHLTIAYDLLVAVKNGDQEAITEHSKKWGQNADEIAEFLNKANPENWPLEEMKHMMHEHLSITTNEVLTFMQKDWEANVAAYDKAHEQMLMMADMLFEGIQKQFPQMFNK